MTEKRAHWSRTRQLSGIILAIALLTVIIARASIPELIDSLETLNISTMIVAYGLNLATAALMAYRWRMLYAIYPPPIPTYPQLLRATFMGMFFNTFLPSTIGGDAYRVVHIAGENSKANALATVWIDRMVGLLSMSLIGLLALMSAPGGLRLPAGLNAAAGLVFAMFSALLALSLSAWFHRLLLHLVARLPGFARERLQARLGRLFGQLTRYAEQRGLLLRTLLVSCLLRLVWFWGCFLVARALDLGLSFHIFLIAIPLIELIRTIPITVQGIGVREGLFVLFFGYYGVSDADATLLAILIYLLLNLNGVIGGVLFLLAQRRSNSP